MALNITALPTMEAGLRTAMTAQQQQQQTMILIGVGLLALLLLAPRR